MSKSGLNGIDFLITIGNYIYSCLAEDFGYLKNAIVSGNLTGILFGLAGLAATGLTLYLIGSVIFTGFESNRIFNIGLVIGICALCVVSWFR